MDLHLLGNAHATISFFYPILIHPSRVLSTQPDQKSMLSLLQTLFSTESIPLSLNNHIYFPIYI